VILKWALVTRESDIKAGVAKSRRTAPREEAEAVKRWTRRPATVRDMLSTDRLYAVPRVSAARARS
jgi:hypothetical protein